MSVNFVSVFKINGVPIIAPLMTASRKAEMADFRLKAIEIEKRMQNRRKEIPTESHENSSEESDIQEVLEAPDWEVENVEIEQESFEYLKITNLGKKEIIAIKVQEEMPKESHEIVQTTQESAQETVKDNPKNTSHCRHDSYTIIASSPGLTNIPVLQSPPPSPIKMEKVQETTIIAKDSSAEAVDALPRLIRSNSYTLESPSPLLMKHMKNSAINIKSSTSLGEISPKQKEKESHVKKLNFSSASVNKPKTKVMKKASSKAVKSVKKAKSPYETKLSTSKLAPKVLKKNSVVVDQKKETPVPDCEKKILEIQEEHNKKMMNLLKRQEEEQLLLQESFRKQQEELMKAIKEKVQLDRITTSTPILPPNDEKEFQKHNISAKEFAGMNTSQSSCSNLSSSQTLFLSSDYEESVVSDELYTTAENRNDVNGNIQQFLNSINVGLQDKDLKELNPFDGNGNGNHQAEKDNELERKNHAATIINAHVRGYLVRRLFHTEQIQKIVQIIRDTLVFIIDLHHEQTEKSSYADLQLKRTLLHQLTAACYSLHDIFFETSPTERLQIIRKDREYLRRKLSRSQNSSRASIRSTASQQIKNLQMCSLFTSNYRA